MTGVCFPVALYCCGEGDTERLRRLKSGTTVGAICITLGLFTFASTRARAQQGTCFAGTSASDIRPVRVNRLSFVGAPSLSSEEVVAATHHAIAQWTDTSAGAGFNYVGETDCSQLGTANGCCDSNLLTYVSECAAGSGRAYNFGGCPVGGVNTRSHTVICGQIGPSGSPITWEVSGVQGGEADLVSSLTHEFGHAIGVNHPQFGERATMGGAIAISDTRRRELYHYDVVCSESGAAGFRSLQPYRRSQLSNGEFSSAWQVTSSYYGNVSNHDAEWYQFGAYGHSGSLWREGDQFRFRRWGTSSTVRSFAAQGLGTEPSLSFHEESTGAPLRIMWARAQFGSEYSLGSLNQVHVRWTDDEFATSLAFPLYECSSMSGYYSCDPLAWTPVTSAFRVKTDYDEYSHRTVATWSHQARSNGAAGDRAVRVSFGDISPALFAPSYEVPGAATSASPGIACEPYAAAGTTGFDYDCIVAFADLNSDDYRIRVGRFFGSFVGGTHLAPVFDTGLTTVDAVLAETAHGVEAWYGPTQGKWYIAFLATDPGQPLRIYESSDSLNWSHVGDYGTSVLRPSVRRVGSTAYLFTAL